MPRKRDPRRDQAYEIWKASNGEKKLKDIAAELSVLDTQIRKWKSQDKWESVKGNVTNSKRNVTKRKEKKSSPVKERDGESLLSDELTDKQRLFCIHYVKTFNATGSMIKAGYAPASAHVEGSKLLRIPKIGTYIRELKAELTETLFLDVTDVIRKYAEIAFADITDYTSFGKKEIEVMTMYGPLKDDDGRPVMKEVNYVDFKESDVVDGTIITEIKQGKDGISVKLADKMKALDKLMLYFDRLPDEYKNRIEKEKLSLETSRIQVEKTRLELRALNGETDNDAHEQGSNYEQALNGQVEAVFADDEDDDDAEA